MPAARGWIARLFVVDVFFPLLFENVALPWLENRLHFEKRRAERAAAAALLAVVQPPAIFHPRRQTVKAIQHAGAGEHPCEELHAPPSASTLAIAVNVFQLRVVAADLKTRSSEPRYPIAFM